MSKTLDLTKQLVAIPSWFGEGCNEIKVGEFIYDWLQKNTDLTVVKQPVKDGRFNIIATDNQPTRTVLVGHIDTVESRAGWNVSPWEPIVIGDNLYGLGATDMKGSLAAMLSAISDVKNTKGLMVLCYIDEEYDFAGMLKFVEEYKDKIKPNLIVSLDGSAGQVGIGCRGLIELSLKIRGVTGHAGRPSSGKNAIRLGSKIIDEIDEKISQITDPILGISTCNLAYLNGGLDLGNNQLGRQGNNIADLAEFVLDIRTSSPKLNAEWVEKQISLLTKSYGITVENVAIRHNLGSWVTSPSKLKFFKSVGLFKSSLGYIDTQMLDQAFNGVTCCTIGAGNLALAHKPNEFVSIPALDSTCTLVGQIIKKFAK